MELRKNFSLFFSYCMRLTPLDHVLTGVLAQSDHVRDLSRTSRAHYLEIGAIEKRLVSFDLGLLRKRKSCGVDLSLLLIDTARVVA